MSPKVLAVKIPKEESSREGADFSDRVDEPPAPQFLWLDRLCNGLLSRAQSRRRPLPQDATPAVRALHWLRPVHSEFEHVFLWTDESKEFPWARVHDAVGKTFEILWAGKFSRSELERGKKYFSSLSEWGAESGAGASL